MWRFHVQISHSTSFTFHMGLRIIAFVRMLEDHVVNRDDIAFDNYWILSWNESNTLIASQCCEDAS